ncbi:hypothetical protein [Saccharothrix violaceirubra]|uniref:Uncharacterized protein n=1 Tax=Saccharothrix violaceirubra TaxID=413306 RepID=A0A7W7SZN4_9PSEU|nr:hypothetical protein [Saccharothrix violaceirubra]MBB4963775.1 hypothetical protein [Saccharothrix violaceirubra]
MWKGPIEFSVTPEAGGDVRLRISDAGGQWATISLTNAEASAIGGGLTSVAEQSARQHAESVRDTLD